MNLLYQLFQNTVDAVLGVDKFQRVCFWNNASEGLFGLSSDQVRDKNCYTVVGGSDLNGDVYCKPDCPLFKKLLRREPVTDYDLVIPGPASDPVVMNVGAFITPETCQHKIDSIAFLVFRHVDSHRLYKRLAGEWRLQGAGSKLSKYHLTTREMEILELIAKGLKTPTIAEQLCISDTTVRNHLKKIFAKMGVHSRAEAISLALRSNFF